MFLRFMKRGIKVWECVDLLNSFVCDFDVYILENNNGNFE